MLWFNRKTAAPIATPADDNIINALDLAFILDTTGSMHSLLHQAQQHMVSLLEELKSGVSLRVGFVEYRDHPPQDKMLTRVHTFESDPKAIQKTIDCFKAHGGGDGPEAVFDGIVAAVNELQWRHTAHRLAVLIGDAPPHGVGASGDAFRNGCPCGQTTDSVTALLEESRTALYSIGLTHLVDPHFEHLASSTGGQYFACYGRHSSRHGAAGPAASDPINSLRAVLEREFGHLEFDGRLLTAYQEKPEASIEELAKTLECGRNTVAGSLARLGRRGLLDVPAAVS
jgi:hypothetical protein